MQAPGKALADGDPADTAFVRQCFTELRARYGNAGEARVEAAAQRQSFNTPKFITFNSIFRDFKLLLRFDRKQIWKHEAAEAL
ncbi:hypothetical protein [Paraburkholderia sp. BL17N1]|uniref:hypothetical protein n=1 Tax=Paraburkholderia sp. BL17N1 TaxID=1938798 RepID=UPI0011C3922C|nr:hypothetical protein [Paraburkholderia sp. BL17N1]